MAIPDGRMSTSPVPGALLAPEGDQRFPLTSHERGPKAVEDTSEGLLYQNWMMTWDPLTGILTLTPETEGSPQVITTIPNLLFINFTFDQNARLSYTYVNDVSSYLYWFDTSVAETVTTDLGADKNTPVIYMDDKRVTQNASNDMLLWYLVAAGETYDLYMARQRDRFTIHEVMGTGIEGKYIQKLGMNKGLRLQIHFWG